MPAYLERAKKIEKMIKNTPAFAPTCAFCNTPMKRGERCRECGAPEPKEKERQR